MSNHHDDHHSNEPKPVSFTTPFILAAVALTAILLLTSIGDPCNDKCVCMENCSKECMEACEKGDHSKNPAKEGHEATEEKSEKAEAAAVETPEAVVPVDSAEAKKEKKEAGH